MPTIYNGGGIVLVGLGILTVAAMTLARPADDEDPRRTEQLAGPRALTVAVLAGLTIAWTVLLAILTFAS